MLEKCKNKFKEQDSFGENFFMTIDGERQLSQSYMGSLCTILIFLMTLLYTVQKFEVLIAKKDVDVLSAKKDLVLSSEDEFSYQNGFNIAVAFTEFNSNQEWELDPKYGTLVINSYSWGVDPDGSYFTTRLQLPTHPCSKEEMGFIEKEEPDEAKAYFFRPHLNSRYYSEFYYKKFICVSRADLVIYGDFNQDEARQFNVQLIRCKGGVDKGCESEDKITEFFRNKWILLYHNQIRFNTFKYGEESIVPEAQLKWLSINT